MTDEPPCGATWHDDLGTQDDTTCTLEHDHHGPHRNPRAGVSWGGPHDWFGGEAA